MSQIKSKNTKPEILVRKWLFSRGFRYRKNAKELPGHPDIVLPKYKTLVFVNGCFWHMHNCKYFVWPKSNVDFWKEKINKNVERDKQNMLKLEEMGWNIITVWECELKKKTFENTMENIETMIRSNL